MSTTSLISRALAALALMLSAVAFTATTASAEPADGRPFRVTIQADAINDNDPSCGSTGPHQILTGTGHATHMGRLTITGETCAAGNGVANWIAANGDMITIEFTTVVTGPPNPDGSLPVAFPALSVSGTGRFTNVVLEDTPLQATVFFAPDGSGAHLEAWLDSRISYDASDRSGR